MSKKIEAKFEMEKITGSKIKLKMILSAKAFDKVIKQVAKHLSESIKINGFRKGNIPFEVS